MHDESDAGSTHSINWYWLAVAVLLLLGLVVRFWRLDLMLFDFDEGVASIYALQLVERGDFPLFGVRTSLGFYNPPTFIYLIAPAFAASKSPLVAVAWLQLMGFAGFAAVTGWLHRLGWRWGTIAFLGVAMLAPGHVLLCRRLWGHALIPALSSATMLLLLHAAYGRRRSLCWMLLPIAVAIAQQVHFSGALLFFDALIVCAVLRVRPHWKALLGGCIAAAATYTPYLVHECRTQFADLQAVASTIAGHTGESDRITIWWAALLSLGDMGGATAMQQYYGRFLGLVPEFHLLRAAGAGVLVVALLACLRHRKRSDATESSRRILLCALLWMAVPLVAFSLLHVVAVPAYWLVALPGPFLLVGLLAEHVGRSVARRAVARWVAAAVLIVVCGGYLRYWYRYNTAMAMASPEVIVYPSYRDQYEAVRYVVTSTGKRPVQLEENNGAESIDYQLLYLVAWLDGNGTRLRHSPAEAQALQHFIINRRPREIAGAENWPKRRFGLLDVYVQPGWGPALVSTPSSQSN
jgi:hypothetical protein